MYEAVGDISPKFLQIGSENSSCFSVTIEFYLHDYRVFCWMYITDTLVVSVNS